MQDLLPWYERELAWLRRYGAEFAERYPKIAGRLQLSADACEDPHVERLIEAFALMAARTAKRIEDDYPEFTDALLEVLYPHYLRPFPSCSIACFQMEHAAEKLQTPLRVPRGSELRSRPVRGIQCRFRSSSEVVLLPLTVLAAEYRPSVQMPMGMSAPANAAAMLTISIGLLGDQAGFAALSDQSLRVFIDGEASFCAAMRDVLWSGVAAAYVEVDDSGSWRQLSGNPWQPVGFAEDEALIDFPARAHPAYRLLTELFAFPEKFGFFDLPLHDVSAGAARCFSLHLLLKSAASGPAETPLLTALNTRSLRLGCTPVVNLFKQAGEPIRLNHRSVTYPVLADAHHAFAHEVYSIDAVARIRPGQPGQSVQEYRPFHCLHHGEDPAACSQYWWSQRNEDVARQHPGHELEMGFVDLDFDPELPQTDVISLRLTCSNRDLPTQLAHGLSGGDLSMDAATPISAITLLRQPSPPLRFARGRHARWRLISHLSLNQLSLTGSGLAALKEMLKLYDLSGSSVSAQQIEGLLALESVAVTEWLPGPRFASMVRGLEIRLTISESHFVGTGIAAFAQVLERVFALYVHANSFTRLVLIASDRGEEIMRCPARSGESILG